MSEVGAELTVCEANESINISHFDGIVISGRRLGSKQINAYNSSVIMEAWDRRIPLLGICYGGEIVAATLGGTLVHLASFQRGFRKVSVVKKSALIGGDHFDAYEAHRIKIARLSDSFEVLAHSSLCEFEAFRAHSREMYGVQFHPELSGEKGLQILANFIAICSKDAGKD